MGPKGGPTGDQGTVCSPGAEKGTFHLLTVCHQMRAAQVWRAQCGSWRDQQGALSPQGSVLTGGLNKGLTQLLPPQTTGIKNSCRPQRMWGGGVRKIKRERDYF